MMYKKKQLAYLGKFPHLFSVLFTSITSFHFLLVSVYFTLRLCIEKTTRTREIFVAMSMKSKKRASDVE